MKNLKRRRISAQPFKKSKKSKINQATAGSVYRPLANVVPQGTIVTLTYHENFLLTGSLGSAWRIFRAASIYDPDFSGAGHQPLGHDQWQALYRRYRVLTCKAEVEMVNSLNNGSPCVAFVTPRESNSGGNATELKEATGAKCKLISSAENNVAKINSFINIAATEGDPGAKYDKDYTASFGTNPIRDQYFFIGAESLTNPTTGTIAAAVTMKMTYVVRLYDRIDLGFS